MGRLIDAEDIKCAFNDTNITEYGLYPNNIVDSIPTAYDVDRVIEELENLIVYEVLDGLMAGEWIKKEQVLKIIKEGGIE